MRQNNQPHQNPLMLKFFKFAAVCLLLVGALRGVNGDIKGAVAELFYAMATYFFGLTFDRQDREAKINYGLAAVVFFAAGQSLDQYEFFLPKLSK